MAISKGNKKNFEVLKQAFANGDAALMEVTDAKSGEKYDAVCAVTKHADGSASFTPFAVMFRENPYERLLPPVPQGD